MVADAMQGVGDWATSPERGGPRAGFNKAIADVLGLPGTQRTIDALSYGHPLGKAGSGGMWQPKSDTVDAVFNAIPLTGLASKGAKTVGQTLAPTAKEMARVAIEKRLVDIGGIQPATVWQGSPHRFAPTAKNPLGEFDATKIGTGEGAQAYGHGHYLADAPEVAKSYAGLFNGRVTKTVSLPTADGVRVPGTYNRMVAADVATQHKGNVQAAIDDAIRTNADPEYIAAARNLLGKTVDTSTINRTHKGNLYKVDLPDEHIARMLDYDNAVPEAVRQKVSQAAMQKFGSGSTGTSGEQLYNEVVKEFQRAGSKNATAEATDFLRQQGIPGIRYLDGGSRAGGAGTSNYVVFPGNEGMLKILERNGQTAAKPNNLVEALKYQEGQAKTLGQYGGSAPSSAQKPALSKTADFGGDKTYPINTTGDVVVGDQISFQRATFSGSFRNAKFEGFERVDAKIVKDSYGKDKQQHTFTLELPDGTTTKIKGRNIYKEGTWRKPWEDESLRKAATDEKHTRGDIARTARDERKMDK